MNDKLTKSLLDITEKSLVTVLDAIKDDLFEYEQFQNERAASVRAAMEEYKQYLLTLDADILSNIADLCESGRSVYITPPVELDTIDDIALTHRAYNMLYGPSDTHNTYPLFAIPKGKYRFVLIAIPVVGETDG